ncbi:MAG: sarcosine oxidase subunit gamma [Parvibaculaceae bacterium]
MPRTASQTVRRSPLEAIARPGRYGASHPSAPGVRIGVRHPLSIVTIIARKGQAPALSRELMRLHGASCPEPGHSAEGKDLTLHWCGHEQWFAVASGLPDGALYESLSTSLKGLASVSDQSHGRVTLTLSGLHARDVLAKGTPVDLHPKTFGPGRSAMTQMAHVGVHLAQVGPDAFELSVFRGFVESFWEWLTEMSAEFGYEVG